MLLTWGKNDFHKRGHNFSFSKHLLARGHMILLLFNIKGRPVTICMLGNFHEFFVVQN